MVSYPKSIVIKHTQLDSSVNKKKTMETGYSIPTEMNPNSNEPPPYQEAVYPDQQFPPPHQQQAQNYSTVDPNSIPEVSSV